MFKEEVIQICSKYISIVQEILLQNGTYRIKRMDFSWSCMKCGSMLGVANGTSKNVGLGKFWQDLEISEAFLTSFEISVFAWFVFTFFESRKFLPKSFGLGFLTRISASWRVSDFTIRQPLCYCVLKIASVTQNLIWEISVSLEAFYYLSLGDQVVKPKVMFSLGL